MEIKLRQKLIFVVAFVFLIIPIFVLADTQGEAKNFFVDKNFDYQQRDRVTAVLEKVSQHAYFYVENQWYKSLDQQTQAEVKADIDVLAQQFDENIYPKMTSVYGTEWKPGIDNDNRITILFHLMRAGANGYFDDKDEYSRLQSPYSNEREMIYVNAMYLTDPIVESYVAHEFTHLITFNQKQRINGVKEDVWLNEARAEYSPTLVGYDDQYQNSNLQRRVSQFIASPSDSLVNWQGEAKDYGMVNIFIHYLVEHYGINILADSMHSREAGINSLIKALLENGYNKSPQKIFTDWTIAVFVNNCSFGNDYCYYNENLKNLKVIPSLIFLPPTQKTDLTLNYAIQPWSGNWYRIVGGEGDLKLKFVGEYNADFSVPYVLCQDTGYCVIKFLGLSPENTAEVEIPDFGTKWNSLTLIPSVYEYSGKNVLHHFSLSISLKKTNGETDELIQNLKKQIQELQSEIAAVKKKIAEILAKQISCSQFSQNISFGQRGHKFLAYSNF